MASPKSLEYLVSGPSALKRKFNKVVDACKRIPIEGANITVDETPDGRVFNAMATKVTSSSVPFGLSWRVDPSDPSGNTFQAKINPASDCLKSLKPNDFLAVSGLGVWFPFLANDVVALYIPVASYVPTSATIQSYGMGTTTFNPTLAAWAGTDNSYVFNDGGTPPNQIGINILLAYSTADPKGKPFVIQAQTDHILLELGNIDGQPALYDWSHRRRYGITYPGP